MSGPPARCSSRQRDIHLLIDFRYKEAVRSLQESPAACPGLRVWDVPDSYDEALVSAAMTAWNERSSGSRRAT